MIAQAEEFYHKEEYKQAEGLCLDILEQFSGNVEALRLQSLIMLRTGRVNEGIEFLKLALDKNPNDAKSNAALGMYFIAFNKMPEAIDALMRAYQIDPQNLEVLLHLGDVYSVQEEWANAAVFYALYINIDSSNALLNEIYLDVVSKCNFKEYSDIQKSAMTRMLQDGRMNVRSLFQHWIVIILSSPEYKDLTQSTIENNTDLDSLQSCLNDVFFTKGIERLRQPNITFEVFITNLRRAFLSRSANDPSFNFKNHRNFLFALVMQCWTNEYVFYCNDDEKEWLQALHDRLQSKDMNWNDENAIALLYLYSCYQSPLKIDDIALHIEKHMKDGDDNFKFFTKIQISDSLEEIEIKKTIPQFTPIDDDVSLAVQSQYEENPYPRRIEPSFSMNHVTTDPTPYNVLFAGCGTGFQVLGFAQKTPNATFTGVDLSLASLAYAIRQTQKGLNFKPDQMCYGHGDILKLADLPDRYDRIFCTGVLHHMNDPEKGLMALKKILKENGEMRLALYSETARKDIVAGQQYIKDNEYGDTADEIRRFRWDMIKMSLQGKAPEFVDKMMKPDDFYTLSECRDLLFHVQEHRYDIPEFVEMLSRNDLEFISFNIKDKKMLANFRAQYPDEGAEFDPMKWHEFEQKNPDSFVGMYSFNVRHKA
jgi:SAM-dependent methyltransferase